MSRMPEAEELALHRFLARLRSSLGASRSVEKTLRAALRSALEFFGGEAACLAVRRPGETRARLVYSLPGEADWELGLLTDVLRGEHPEMPPDIRYGQIHRRGRVWGTLVLRRPGAPDWLLQGLHETAHVMSELAQEIDRRLLADVRSRIDHKIMDRLRPRDLFYQILDGLRSLTRYDHSSALLVAHGDRLALAAEQIAWRKDVSRRIGETFALGGAARAELEEGRVRGFAWRGGGWKDWTGHGRGALADLLDYNRDPVPSDFERERAMIVAPLGTRQGAIGVLKIAARHPGNLGAYEIDLVTRLVPQAAVALQRSDLAQSAVSLQERVLAAEKRSAMATLARGVAHDLNNTLGGILLRVQQARSDLEDDAFDREQMAATLARTEEGLHACRRIFGGMLAFARGEARAKGRVIVARALKEALALQEPRLERQHIETVVDVPADLPVVHGRQTDLAQIFLNLVANAVEAMPGGGTLRVTAGIMDGGIEVAIADTGTGIPPEALEHVHDAFVTTKTEGSGLGLPIVRSLLSDLGGELHLESAAGGGTVARVTLPVMETPVTETEVER